MGEVPDYDNFVISHGLCTNCERHYRPWPSDGALDRAIFLRNIFRKLFEAGKRSDFDNAAHIIDKAVAAGCRPVDILIGMIAPMLYRIGEDWRKGTVSVHGEHQFTAFCERVIELIAERLRATAAPPKSGQPQVFLMNAPGNKHTLALQILGLWFESRMVSTFRLDSEIGFEELIERLVTSRPKYLLISISLVEQRIAVQAIIERLIAWPSSSKPTIVIGGYAVKAGLLQPMAGADLTADIRTLNLA